MADATPEVIHPKQLPSATHHVIVKLEAVHVDPPHVDPEYMSSLGLTHEMISYMYTSHQDKAQVAARVRDASIILTVTVPITEAVLDAAPHLKCVISETTGLNHIDTEACRRRGITVFFSPGASAEAVSEHALAMYFSLRRRLLVLHNTMMQYNETQPNRWKASGSMSGLLRDADDKPPRTCETEVAGILGGGPIGQRIATLCQNLGMRALLSARKSADPSVPVPEGRTPFSEIIRDSTIIFIVLPLTAETKSTISAAELKAMRPDAVIVNVGRGGLVDEQALLDAVRDRKIYGAATDVFVHEPAGNDTDSVLLSKTVAEEGLNLVYTPHLAWCADTTRTNIRRVVGENLRSYLEGGEKNLVVEGRVKSN